MTEIAIADTAVQVAQPAAQVAIDLAALRVTEAIAALHKHFGALLDERDIRYRERFEASQTALQAALCMSADTPILCADLVWRPAGDLLVGDQLVAFDEEGPDRCYRRAVVTANSLKRGKLLRVNTDKGHVRCTHDHPFLLRRYRGHAYEWRKAEDLRPEDTVRKPLEVWDVARTYEAGWLAGILDGEGCLTFASYKSGCGKISIGQVVGPTAGRIEEALKGLGVSLITHVAPVRDGFTNGGRAYTTQAQQRWSIVRFRDVMRVLGSIRPYRLLVEADRVWEGRQLKARNHGLATITSIEPAGTGMIASLSTSTKTYLGGGFAVHNTAQEKAVAAALAAAEKLNSAALTSAERAVIKAETAAEKRFESVNEFRATLQDQAAMLIGRNEVQARFDAFTDKIDLGVGGLSKEITGILSRLDRFEGAATGVNWLATGIAGAAGILLSWLAMGARVGT